MMDVIINQMEGTISQYMHISNHYDGHYKYLTILSTTCTPVKLEKKKKTTCYNRKPHKKLFQQYQ